MRGSVVACQPFLSYPNYDWFHLLWELKHWWGDERGVCRAERQVCWSAELAYKATRSFLPLSCFETCGTEQTCRGLSRTVLTRSDTALQSPHENLS
jgi:hypothetical protein